jgi:hypothetical protein
MSRTFIFYSFLTIALVGCSGGGGDSVGEQNNINSTSSTSTGSPLNWDSGNWDNADWN